MGSLENPESVTIILEPEAAAIHCRNARLKHSKVLSKISFQDTYETDYCVLNEVSEGKVLLFEIHITLNIIFTFGYSKVEIS